MSAEVTVIRPWFNNSSANDGTCFDVQFLSDGTVQTRNSRIPGEVTNYTAAEWDVFIEGAIAGKFNRV